MKVVITGTTRGLGKTLCEYFRSNGHEVVEANRGAVITPDCDLFINNSYADGNQICIFNELYDKVPKMIVMGSIASDYPDPTKPKYSQDKKELKERVLGISNTLDKKSNILLLQLTGHSYNNSNAVLKAIEFWLENPIVNCISFIPGEQNE